MLAQKSDTVSVDTPNNVLDGRGGQFGQCLLLLDVEQDDRGGGRQQEGSGTSVKDLVGLSRQLDGLGQGIVEVTDFNRLQADCINIKSVGRWPDRDRSVRAYLSSLVEDGETVSSDENSRRPLSALSLDSRISDFARSLARQGDELVDSVVRSLRRQSERRLNNMLFETVGFR